MNIYLVGGAVRDRLLGYPSDERDWVVVGATPEEMIAKGFTPVGKDFPVFLHPRTKEEYALARTERKSGRGYHGFVFNASPEVTLEQDLARRDLTINAIAQKEDGELIDPFGGQRDLDNKVLRHVSEAFREDPVRILRIARFAARYRHLGFHVADETISLMGEMVATGEAEFLVAERVWKEFSRALLERSPQAFLDTLDHCHALAAVLPELMPLMETQRRERTMAALSRACTLSPELCVRFASLAAQLDKFSENQTPDIPTLARKATPQCDALNARLKTPKNCQELAILVNRFFVAWYQARALDAARLVDLLYKTDALRRPARFEHFLLCCQAINQESPNSQANSDHLRTCFAAIKNVDSNTLLARGYRGATLGEKLRDNQVDMVKQTLSKAQK